MTPEQAKYLDRIRREVTEAAKVPAPKLSEAEVFRGFTDEPLDPEEARQNIIDAGGF